MTRFLDGPAAGERMNLTRTPPFLRVAYDCWGKVGAMTDLEEDAPRGGKVYAYRRLEARPQNGRAHYKLCHPQPSSPQRFHAVGWAAWCMAQKHTPSLP